MYQKAKTNETAQLFCFFCCILLEPNLYQHSSQQSLDKVHFSVYSFIFSSMYVNASYLTSDLFSSKHKLSISLKKHTMKHDCSTYFEHRIRAYYLLNVSQGEGIRQQKSHSARKGQTCQDNTPLYQM